MSYNVHCLIHLCDDVRKFGTIQNFSAFKFENYMYQIKQKLKTSGKPLNQIINRINEANILDNSLVTNQNYPRIHFASSNTQKLKLVEFPNFSMSNKASNNCCVLKNKNIAIVEELFIQNKKIFMTYKYFTKFDSLFNVPCDSSIIGIYSVHSDYLSQDTKTADINDISSKCVNFPSFDNNNFSTIMKFLHV